ncbi:MAG: TIGR02302 family protein [Hyphomicrobiaceae bacterium]|nr:TIGR02302 family protein [Hyphomicrobiaceae bacterium]
MFKKPPTTSTEGRGFERKISLSRSALLLERLWPRLWLVIAVLGVFILVSFAGLWMWLPPLAHEITLGGFGLALLAALVAVLRVRWPTREEALRRIERRSGVPHRPATSYEDTLTAPAGSPATERIWLAHRSRLAALLARLRVGTPQPRTDRTDPFALRALLVLGVVLLLGLVGDSAKDRLLAAFRFTPDAHLSTARLDAWITPPAYTGKPPILLADGGNAGFRPARAEAGPIEVPEKSLLIIRASGAGQLALELAARSSEKRMVEGQAPKAAGDVSEVRTELRHSGAIRVLGGGSQVALWQFNVIPDHPPRVVLTKEPERTIRGGLKLFYKVEDDYGVASAEARFARPRTAAGDPRTSWAREDILKGPRPPLERPPVLRLHLPRHNAKESETSSFHQVGAHPWAGMKVRMTLQAKDHAGNTGSSQPIEIVLPQRRFTKPLALALVEQRRKLVEDPRYRRLVVSALDALTLEPDGFITDRHVYLGLRSAYHRLSRDSTRSGIRSVVDQLWHLALRIEDGGGLTDAERRLRDIQDQLSKALEEGASDEEIARLMQELRQALAEFMQQLQRQAEGQQMQMPEGFNPNQVMRPEDLERMLNQLESMARQGSRESAQEMLSQLRELLESLQAGRMMGQQGQQGQQMMQMMDQMGDLIGKQQHLYDDTFGEQRRQGEPGQQGQRGQQGQQGQRGRQGRQFGQQGQQGQGQQGQQGQGQQGQQFGPGELSGRQGQLRDQLGRMRQGMRQFGMRPPSQLDGAEQSMENARRALEQGELDTATREQSRALEQLRQGAQSMAEQMLRQMPSRFGQGPAGDAPRDPLGRPQRSEGPDLGTSVKVPDEIDMQRAREILEELRRRLGESTRPLLELDYIERLLRRF